MGYYKNILETIGNTPAVRLNKITKGIKATLLAKIEYFNPGGSVKDRIGISMLEDAERKGLIKPGGTIVEPTSGNTGIGLALAAVTRGYNIIFTMPDKMSEEKRRLLRAFGAKVIVTPTAVEPDDPRSYIETAKRIVKETPNTWMPDQYRNPNNPKAHYETTGPEIWKQTNGKIDVFVAGMGTGGTITGVGKYLKEKNPNIEIVGADPEGSMFYHEFYGTKGKVHTYKVEGIGEDFMPTTLDLSVVDEIIKVNDKESFLMARRLAKEEGLLVGGSAGSAVYAALKIAKKLNKDKTVVVLLPDTGRNYLSKIYSDEWMIEHGFLKKLEEDIRVNEILKQKSKRMSRVVSVKTDDKLKKAINLLRKYDISQLLVLKDDRPVGSVKEISIMKKMMMQKIASEQRVVEVMDDQLPTINKSEKLSKLYELLLQNNAVIVLDKRKIIGVLTTIDIINYLSKRR